jgi:hypothetical protein
MKHLWINEINEINEDNKDRELGETQYVYVECNKMLISRIMRVT